MQANVVGTQVLLDVAKAKNAHKFLYVSTDEVYGTLPEDKPEIKFTEETPLQPNSPYSASKAAGDCLVRSYFHTFHMPVLTTRCSNNYGPYHFPEKLIPLFVTNLIEGRKVPLYGDGLNVRDWLYVEDHCDAIWAVLNRGKSGEVYNVGGNNEITNRKITETILREMGSRLGQISPVRQGPPRPRPPLRHRRRQDQARAGLGAEAPLRYGDQDDDSVVPRQREMVAGDQERGVSEVLRYAICPKVRLCRGRRVTIGRVPPWPLPNQDRSKRARSDPTLQELWQIAGAMHNCQHVNCALDRPVEDIVFPEAVDVPGSMPESRLFRNRRGLPFPGILANPSKVSGTDAAKRSAASALRTAR